MGWSVELIKLIPQSGGFVGYVVLVVIFLWFMAKFLTYALFFMKDIHTGIQTSISALADKFHETNAETRREFQSQIQTITEQNHEQNHLYQEHINGVVKEYITVARETAHAMGGLEVAVRDLQSKIK